MLKISAIERLSPVWDGIKGSSSSEVQEMTKNVGGKKVPLKKSLFFFSLAIWQRPHKDMFTVKNMRDGFDTDAILMKFFYEILMQY